MSWSRSRGVVVGEPGGQDVRFEDREGNRRTLELLDRFEQVVRTVAAGSETVPGRQEAAEGGRLDRLDLAA